ncbi:DUF5908 family protein [Tenacibaculum halocynthiae]|uniref:DUF5908 family protein n=1 Tax=Tenacibaculum halocynthiae TaxID=1254437 RepID=UPI003893E30B
MPVEIRELIIKTEIKTEVDKRSSLNDNEVYLLKEELVEMCKRMLSEEIKRTSYRR